MVTPKTWQHEQGTEKGHRQTHGHPEAVTEAEEQPQHEEHQQQTLGTVAHQHVKPILHHRGPVLGQCEFRIP